jgi:hypothetical protein
MKDFTEIVVVPIPFWEQDMMFGKLVPVPTTIIVVLA